MDNSLTNKNHHEAMQGLSSDGSVTLPEGKKLHISKGMEGVDFTGIMAKLSQYVNIGNTISHIEKVKQYIVQIPLELQEGFEKGQYFFNQTKGTGTIWPSLMEKTANGQCHFAGNLPIVEESVIKGNPMGDITTNFYNLAMQKQLTEIADAVKSIYEVVEQIQRGQMDDRIAKIRSGREQIQTALAMKDKDAALRQIASGRQSVYEGKNQLGLALKRKIESFAPIPESTVGQLIYGIKVSYSKRDEEVEEIQTYYQFYLEAIKLLAASYFFTGEQEAAQRVFDEGIAFVKTINFEKIQTIRYVHKLEDIQQMFVYNADTFLEAECESMTENSSTYDYMLIDVSGEDLLEVLNHGEEV